MSLYQPPELLAARHQLAGFRCRSEEQTAWLVEVARQAYGTGTTRVFVVTEVDQPQEVAYYAWCMASVAIADLPERLRRGAAGPPDPATIALAPLADGHARQAHAIGDLCIGFSSTASEHDLGALDDRMRQGARAGDALQLLDLVLTEDQRWHRMTKRQGAPRRHC